MGANLSALSFNRMMFIGGSSMSVAASSRVVFLRSGFQGRLLSTVILGVALVAAGCSSNRKGGISSPALEDRLQQESAIEQESASLLPESTVGVDSVDREPTDITKFLAARATGDQELMSDSKTGLEFRIVSTANTTRLLVKTGDEVPVFRLSKFVNPERLVLDISNSLGRVTKNFNVKNSGQVDRVRLGAHGDKERVVLDIKPGISAAHQAEVIDGAIILTVSEDMPSAQSELARYSDIVSENNMALAAPALDRLDIDSSSERAIEERDLASIASTKAESVVGVHHQNASAGLDAPTLEESPQLLALQIEQLNGANNQLVATVSSSSTYSLKRTAPSEYVLRLNGATVGVDTIRPVVAPPQSGLIRSARALQDEGAVLLRIFAAPATELSAHAESGRIVVAANIAPTSTVEDVQPLAQLGDADAAKSDSSQSKSIVTESEVAANPETTFDESELTKLLEGENKYTGRLISLDLQDTDIDNALRIIAEVSNLNIIASDDVTGKVTLRLIDVPWDQALDVILKTNGLDKVQEGNVIRVAPVEKLRAEREALKEAQRADEELQALLVRYIRISYAKGSDIKPLVETVLTERGSVAVDERSNQLIVKDIQKGIQNVAELVRKLDLRTPQVLLETQIIEAQRNFLRDLGTELGFNYIQSPETGNATGYNFPNSVGIGGSVSPDGGVGSSFPAALGEAGGSAVSLLLGSADGSRSLDLRISSLEQEGRIRVVSRPSVATINNKQAIIKSVEKIRVRTPDSGLSVATGQGAVASGGSASATETFEVGITLEVTPQASPDYYVLLDINAKSSTLGATVVDGIPSEVERSATSTVLVSSGQTFALGGIYKITDNETLDGVPFLKDVPFFGYLFRRSLVDNGDEELIFFLTPRIVEGSFDDAAMKATV